MHHVGEVMEIGAAGEGGSRELNAESNHRISKTALMRSAKISASATQSEERISRHLQPSIFQADDNLPVSAAQMRFIRLKVTRP